MNFRLQGTRVPDDNLAVIGRRGKNVGSDWVELYDVNFVAMS